MALQFQSVGALTPFISAEYGLGLTDIGLLIGLYLAPGVVVAIPGGAIASWLGDIRVVGMGILLMLVGGVIMTWGSSWDALVVGRVLAGTGGVTLNVVMSKMVLDWFAGREISTAMAIFINSWPIGIALGLLILPPLAVTGGLQIASFFVLGAIAAALVLFLAIYEPADMAAATSTTVQTGAFPVYALFLAGSVWALYNAALAMVFSFGPALLQERGLELTAASASVSLFMTLLAIAIPIGGYIADKTQRRDTVITVSSLSYLVLIPVVLYGPPSAAPAVLGLLGFVFGLAAGPIVGLPADILPVKSRAFAMGIYYTIYYAVMMVAPLIAGALADRIGRVSITLVTGLVMMALGLVAFALVRAKQGMRQPG